MSVSMLTMAIVLNLRTELLLWVYCVCTPKGISVE